MAGESQRIDLHRLVADLADALGRGDLDAIRSTLTDDIVVEHPAFGVVVGVDANIAVIADMLAGAAPTSHELADLVVEGERAAFRLVIRGIVRAERRHLPPPGSDVEWAGIVFVHAPAGRIEWAAVATERAS